MAARKKAEKPAGFVPYQEKKQLHVLLTDAEMAKIVRLAKKHDTTGTGLIRKLLKEAS